MIAQERLLVLGFSKKEKNGTVLVDQFLKEALSILKHADTSLCNNTIQDEAVVETEQEDAVTWKLKLTPTMMTLETRILTISELEKVLESIRTNVKPQPPKFRDKKRVNSDGFDISYFQYIIKPVLKLSSVISIPHNEQLSQYNSMQLIRHCVQSFIDCGYSFFLDVPSLIANTEMILSKPGAAKENRVETLLILSICTLMIRHTTIHHRGDLNISNSLMQAYYSQARQLLQDLFDVHHTLVVQSMFILSLFPQGHTHLFSPTRIKSPLLTIAIRMGLAMDLHKLDKERDLKEPEQKEKLRRFAWMLLCSDYYSDWNSTGNHGFIQVEDWHVDFPQPLLPSEHNMIKKIEFFSQYCRVIMIRKLELFKSAYMISLQSTKALKSGLDEQLFKTYFNTPDMFKLNLDDSNQIYSKNDLESLLLHELYCHTQLFAQLPFLPSRYFQDFILTKSSNLQPIIYQQHQQPIVNLSTDLEFYCLVGCLSVINHYTQTLEALTSIDTIGCHHSPVYGAIVTIHLYLIIQNSCQYNEIRTICQINLVRSYRILRQATSIYTDPTIQYLESILVTHNVISKEDTPICTLNKRASELIRSLKAKTSLLKQEDEQ